MGGYVIVDDYAAVPGCRAAVEDFRAAHDVKDELRVIDWSGVFWQRAALRSIRRIVVRPAFAL